MQNEHVSQQLMRRVEIHSKLYETRFRGHPSVLDKTNEKDRHFIMVECPIILAEDLPADHPQIRSHGNRVVGKWNAALAALKLGARGKPSPTTFADCLFVLQHDTWYTTEGLQLIRDQARAFVPVYHEATSVLSESARIAIGGLRL